MTSPHEHRFPVHGDHRCECGQSPEGFLREVLEAHDRPSSACPTCHGPATFHFGQGTGTGGWWESVVPASASPSAASLGERAQVTDGCTEWRAGMQCALPDDGHTCHTARDGFRWYTNPAVADARDASSESVITEGGADA